MSVYCRDCKWVAARTTKSMFGKVSIEPIDEYAKCEHPQNISVVTGLPDKFCNTIRNYGFCGIDGKMFKEK